MVHIALVILSILLRLIGALILFPFGIGALIGITIVVLSRWVATGRVPRIVEGK
jgi:hypothetical protein